MRKEEYSARRVVGMIWPPPREMASEARERSVILNLVLRIAGAIDQFRYVLVFDIETKPERKRAGKNWR